MTGGLVALLILTFLVLVIVAKTAVVVPQQSAYVVERLGRFHGILNAGFHVLLPFVDVIRYRHSLKETAVDIPAQVCITRDNVQVGVDGVLYLKVLNPERASYGISDYMFAISQLAQTTLRSEVGKIDLDRTFEERTNINTQVVSELDKASEAWGVKVLRYEIKNITPPADILAAMEKQMRAEREKRAVILTSEGTRDAAINTAEGMKQEVIKQSEARKQQQINEAEGEAAAITSVATATAAGIRSVAEAIKLPGGQEAVQLRVAEQYIGQFGELAKKSNTIVLPANVADVGIDDRARDEDDSEGESLRVQSPESKSPGVQSPGVTSMANERTVLITGATGKQGGATARALAGKGFTLRAMTRNPESDAAKAVASDNRRRAGARRPQRRGVVEGRAEGRVGRVCRAEHLGGGRRRRGRAGQAHRHARARGGRAALRLHIGRIGASQDRHPAFRQQVARRRHRSRTRAFRRT